MSNSHILFNRFSIFAAGLVTTAAFLLILTLTASGQKLEPGAASADIDQCRNGGIGEPVQRCVGNGTGALGWVNGNAGPENAHWAENEFIPYRIRFADLEQGTHTVVIGYDIFHNGKHAIDYLGTYNATATDADPCSTVTGCGGTPSTYAIPPDEVTVTSQLNPNTGANISQIPGVFTLWGGTIINVQYLPYAGGDERRIAVTFANSVSNPVLAWGGHIAWIGDWGVGNSASAINGSPYHMRLISLNGRTLGNQDRSLKNTAVVASGAVIIKKEVNTSDGSGASTVAFSFTATPNFGVTSFSLVDDNSGPGTDFQMSQAIVNFGSSSTITVTENAPPEGWTLVNVNCVENMTQDSTKNQVGPASIVVQPGEVVTCTFTNSGLAVTAAPASISGRVRTESGAAIRRAFLTLTNISTGQTRVALSNSFGYYRFDDVMTDDVYTLSVSSKSYTFAESQRTFTLREELTDLDFVATPSGGAAAPAFADKATTIRLTGKRPSSKLEDQ